MGKQKRSLQVIGIETRVIGQPTAVTALPSTEELGVRYVVDWPMVAEVVSGAGEGWIGPTQVAVVLEGQDVDKFLAGLRAAGWSPAGWSSQP